LAGVAVPVGPADPAASKAKDSLAPREPALMVVPARSMLLVVRAAAVAASAVPAVSKARARTVTKAKSALLDPALPWLQARLACQPNRAAAVAALAAPAALPDAADSEAKVNLADLALVRTAVAVCPAPLAAREARLPRAVRVALAAPADPMAIPRFPAVSNSPVPNQLRPRQSTPATVILWPGSF